jgi:hypothetical protein
MNNKRGEMKFSQTFLQDYWITYLPEKCTAQQSDLYLPVIPRKNLLPSMQISRDYEY